MVTPGTIYSKDCRDAVLFYRRSKINITELTNNNLDPGFIGRLRVSQLQKSKRSNTQIHQVVILQRCLNVLIPLRLLSVLGYGCIVIGHFVDESLPACRYSYAN